MGCYPPFQRRKPRPRAGSHLGGCLLPGVAFRDRCQALACLLSEPFLLTSVWRELTLPGCLGPGFSWVPPAGDWRVEEGRSGGGVSLGIRWHLWQQRGLLCGASSRGKVLPLSSSTAIPPPTGGPAPGLWKTVSPSPSPSCECSGRHPVGAHHTLIYPIIQVTIFLY